MIDIYDRYIGQLSLNKRPPHFHLLSRYIIILIFVFYFHSTDANDNNNGEAGPNRRSVSPRPSSSAAGKLPHHIIQSFY